MSKLPQLNLRIPSEHHELVRQIAERLRESSAASFAASLQAFLGEAPQPVPVSSTELAERVAVLADRLAELEGWRQSFETPREVAPVLWATPLDKRRDKIPLELLAEARDLHATGLTWTAVAREISAKLGYEVSGNGLRNAIRERLKA